MTDDDFLAPAPAASSHVYVPEPDYGGWDYLRLPDCGRDHYNLEDAALLGALDWWSSDRIPEFPLGDLGFRDADEPAVRKGVAPTQERILAMLLRSIEGGHLPAEVFGRDMATSRPLPDRTFVGIGDLIECLEKHGHPPGDYLNRALEDSAEARQFDSDNRAERRAQFRHATYSSSGTSAPDDVAVLRAELRAKDLHIAHLQSQVSSGRPATSSRPLGNKERNTLLAIIAALCSEAKLDYAKSSKTANLIQAAAAQMGVSLGETTIENKLKEIPDALASRMK